MISVIIPTFDRPQALLKCISALSLQQYDGQWEVIIVDDGGLHNLSPVVAGFETKLNITLIRQARNKGPASARNAGAYQASGEYLAFLDDDCEPDVNWIRAVAVKLRSGVLLGGYTKNKLSNNTYSEASQLLVSYLYSYFKETPWYFFTSNNFVMDKVSFFNIGGFDESFTTSAGEDRAFCARWIKYGYQLEYVPSALVWHSHELTLSSFCSLHSKYGKAAAHFRVKLREWGIQENAFTMRFYFRLVSFVCHKEKYSAVNKLNILLLLALSQLCTFYGAMTAVDK
ncbi:glycosyltransferase family 2 protein [Arenicella xantha]|uniref:GT2 family glycosyltransferase n=1 Tax=Arenicella xantha TaxID=644221 RepID=A0A395JNS4_9GAMM|nr:glycosyltransferase family 2 protein [Arenicella xantha]RBP52963.1 GT2 family glycosyltransferase [Arenicella xantha]